ncbi:MAG: hypothetical protein COA38_20540 [Fluviicola sp.]|nr:MAG: hypothetical protein COA38_20540 [Fluviicola sp.]
MPITKTVPDSRQWCAPSDVAAYKEGVLEWAKIPAWFTTTESDRFKGLDKDRTLVIMTRIHPDDLAAPCCPWVGK